MNDHLTTRLSRQLHAQADDWQGAPLTLESVQGTARTIRRRRRAAAGSVLAVAVLAVAIPIGVTFGGGSDTSPPPANPPTRLVDTDNPVEDSPLGVSFIEGRTLTLPNGAQTRLPQAYPGGVVLGDTALGLRSDNGDLFLDVIESGAVDETIPLDTGFARNADGTAIAIVTGGELVVRWESGQTSFGAVPSGLSPVRLVGGPDCSEAAGTCAVYLDDQTGGAPRVITTTGANQLVVGGPLSIGDVSEDGRLTTMTTEVREGDLGACGRVYDQTTQTTVFRTCEVTLERFSPGGQYVSADVAYQDGLRGYIAILDAQSGEKVAELLGDGSFFNEVVWEDAEHLVAVSFRDGEGWSVIRLGVDGSVETAYGPVDGPQDVSPLHLLGN